MKWTLTLCFLVAGSAAFAQDKTMTCDNQGSGDRARFCEIREQSMPSSGRLEVDGQQNGGISVKGWDRSDVLVRSQVTAQGADMNDSRTIAAQVNVHAMGYQVSADGPSGKNWSVSYEIFVPRQHDVTLTANNGGIHLQGIRGNLNFKTVNGGVHLANLAGNVTGSTSNGGVHVELTGARWDGQGINVQTSNGGVHIAMPANYGAHLESSTVNGGLHSDFSDLVRERQQHQISADINGGGPTLRIVTTNGGVHIQKTT